MTFINYMATEREGTLLSEKKVNVFANLLVPKHTLLSPEEVEKVLNKYRIKRYQLPKIKASDPAALTIQAQPGDVIKILRKSPTAGEAIAYRYVVES
jgi:DNA-directed RNA polymerase subunit H